MPSSLPTLIALAAVAYFLYHKKPVALPTPPEVYIDDPRSNKGPVYDDRSNIDRPRIIFSGPLRFF